MTKGQEEYARYLQTDYWKAVSLKVKERAGFRCQLCNSKDNLAAHHRTYQNRGSELEHLDDLICLCEKCHSSFHGRQNKIEDNAKKKHKRVKGAKFRRVQPSDIPVEPSDPLVMMFMPPQVDGSTEVVLTWELVQRLMTGGGLTSLAVAPLGIKIPEQKKGWVKRLFGTKIPRATYRQCLMGRFTYERRNGIQSPTSPTPSGD